MGGKGGKGKGKERTVFPSNASITRSPDSLDPNTISASIIGRVFTTRQLSISPPTGVMTLSISADVVPGAKFCISTEKGPASPRIEISGALAPLLLPWFWPWPWLLGPVGGLNFGPVGATVVGSTRWRAPASLAVRLAARGLPPGAETRDARLGAETVVCRSCVHSPLMLPAGRPDVEATLYSGAPLE